MNHYETIFIVDPDTPETDQDSIFEKLKSIISVDGQLIMFDDWGSKKFAYEIRKKKQGRFVRLDYCGEGVLVDEIERLFRLDYRILKFMTVLLAQDVDPESLMPVEDEPEATPEATPEAKTEAAETKNTSSTEETSDEAVETETTKTDSETEE